MRILRRRQPLITQTVNPMNVPVAATSRAQNPNSCHRRTLRGFGTSTAGDPFALGSADLHSLRPTLGKVRQIVSEDAYS